MQTSIVRTNMLKDVTYSPYCGATTCSLNMPRTTWNATKKQFTCKCGWISSFPNDFIKEYTTTHNLK